MLTISVTPAAGTKDEGVTAEFFTVFRDDEPIGIVYVTAETYYSYPLVRYEAYTAIHHYISTESSFTAAMDVIANCVP